MNQFDNGMKRFSLHAAASPEAPQPAIASLAPLDAAAIADPLNRRTLTALGPEAAARMYLQNAIASPDLPGLTAPSARGAVSEFKTLGTEVIPLTQSITCKFRQQLNGIPVYGSLVTVELDESNQLLALNSSLGAPEAVNPVATVSPAEALYKVRERAGYGVEPLSAVPRLFYYFDEATLQWKLVFIVEDVPVLKAPADAVPAGDVAPGAEPTPVTPLMDYVIDAHTGELVAELPRTSWAWVRSTVTAPDALGISRKLFCEEDSATGNKRLQDPLLGVSTFDYRFSDIDRLMPALPGDHVLNPPSPWLADAISAHANAVTVLNYYREVLRRNSLDDRGFPLRSSINCISTRLNAQGKVWANAVWNGRQMIYGQVAVGGALRTLATALDIVAHEITHGLTQFTARLEYRSQTGALNESFSDIFGILVANEGKPIDQWSWEIGAGLGVNPPLPLRDMSNPARCGQPASMAFYVAMPLNQDAGGVHKNSGIHNKAAFNLITTKDAAGLPLFAPSASAALFYLALTQHLSRTSGFSDSRKGVELAAATLFRSDPRLQEKLDAIRAAFDATGIV